MLPISRLEKYLIQFIFTSYFSNSPATSVKLMRTLVWRNSNALFSLRRLKNFENENSFLCFTIGEIDMGVKSGSKKNRTGQIYTFSGGKYPDSMTCSLLEREILWHHISKTREATGLKFCTSHAFMAIMTHKKFHFNLLMITLIFWHPCL